MTYHPTPWSGLLRQPSARSDCMRILQVVTLLSPDGAYGGPARVALNQGAELINRGHDVIVAAAARGYPDLPTESNGVPLRLFAARRLVPGTGFAGLGAPALNRWFGRNRTDFDVVHIHFGRDLVVLPVAAAARRHKIPYVLQTHGMVTPSDHPLAPALDALWTRKAAPRRRDRVLPDRHGSANSWWQSRTGSCG